MGFFSKKRTQSPSQIVAVDLGQSHLLVLATEKKSEGIEISNFRMEKRPSTPELVSSRLREIFRSDNLLTSGVRAGLKSDGTVIRILTFPQMKRSEIESMLQYEAEKFIPFKVSEVVLDFQILKEEIQRGDHQLMEILLIAVKKKEIEGLLSIFQNGGLRLGLLDVCAFSISNLLEFTYPQLASFPISFLDMGVNSSNFGILVKNNPVFIREISYGTTDIFKQLKRKLGISAESLEEKDIVKKMNTPEYQAVIEQSLLSLVNEIRLSLGYYLDHSTGTEPIQSMYVMGGGFRFVPDLKRLSEQCGLPIARPDFFSRFSTGSGVNVDLLKHNEDLIPSALGLCVRDLP